MFGTITVQPSSGSQMWITNVFMPFTTPANPSRGSSHDMTPEYESSNTKKTYFTDDKTIVPTFPDMISDYNDDRRVETTTKHHSNEDDVITRMAIPHPTLPAYEEASSSINGKSFSLKTLFTNVMTTKRKDGVDIFPSTDDTNDETITTPSPYEDKTHEILLSTVKQSTGNAGEDVSTLLYETNTTPETSTGIYAVKQSSSLLYGEDDSTTPSYEMFTAPETDLTDTLSSPTIFGSVSSEPMGDGKETKATHESDDRNLIKNVLTTPSTQSSKVFNTTTPAYGNSATQEAYSATNARKSATAFPDINRNPTGDSTGKRVSNHKSNSSKEENSPNNVFGTIPVQPSSGSLSDTNVFMPFTTPAKPSRGSSHDMTPEYESSNTKQTYFTDDKTIVPTFPDLISDYNDDLRVETTTMHHSNEDDVITRMAIPHPTFPAYEEASSSINGKSFSLKTLFTNVMTTKRKDGVDIFPSTDDTNDETITTPSPYEDKTLDILFSTFKQSTGIAGEDASTLLYETNTTPETSTGIYAVKQSSSLLYGEDDSTTPSYEMFTAPETDLTDTLSSPTIFGSVSSDSMGDGKETKATHESDDRNLIKNVLTTPSTQSSKVFNITTPAYGSSATQKAYSTTNARKTATAFPDINRNPTGDSTGKRVSKHKSNSSKEENSLNNVFGTITVQPSSGSLSDTNAFMPFTTPAKSSRGSSHDMTPEYESSNTKQTDFTDDKTIVPMFPDMISDYIDDLRVESTTRHHSNEDDVITRIAIPHTTLPDMKKLRRP